VLPGPPGTTHHVPPDGGRCDHPRYRTLRPDPGSLHRQEPLPEARGPQVRRVPHDRPPHVLGRARHDRFVLPGPRLQLHLPVEQRPVLRTV
ncbi:uncharacterized protein METZ01_LOCUS329365, partial [marine metagenome]